MSSNEHPDMSGNPCDAPFVCEKCGHQFTDDAKLCGSFFNSETILCSQECSVEYDYAIAERLTAENARLDAALRETLQRECRWIERVAELESELGCQAAAMLMREQQAESLKQRVAELENMVLQKDAALWADNKKLNEELTMVYTTGKLAQDNARLRESIQSVLGYVALPKRYRDELQAAIAKGE